MILNGQLVCDRCQKEITRLATEPQPDWAPMHNLCSACFAAVKATSVRRPD